MRILRVGVGLAMAAMAVGCGTAPGAPGSLGAGQQALSALGVGISIQNFAKVDDTLYRGAQPTADDLVSLAQMGVKTDICLLGLGRNDAQTIAQERIDAQSAGIRFVNVVVPFLTEPSQTVVDQFLTTVENPVNQPSYTHCKLGHDRTGAMVAAYRIQHDGWTAQQALAEMEQYGYSPAKLPALERFVMSYQPDLPRATAQ